MESKVRCCMDTPCRVLEDGLSEVKEADYSNCHLSSDTQGKRYLSTGKDEITEILEYRNPIYLPLGGTWTYDLTKSIRKQCVNKLILNTSKLLSSVEVETTLIMKERVRFMSILRADRHLCSISCCEYKASGTLEQKTKSPGMLTVPFHPSWDTSGSWNKCARNSKMTHVPALIAS